MGSARGGKGAWRRLVILLVAVATTGAAHSAIDTSSAGAGREPIVPSPARARLFSLGFDAAVADYYWIQALQLVGGLDSNIEAQGPSIARLIEVTTAIDPWVDHPYRFAAVWLTRTPELVERANAMLARGISYHPLEWRNRYHLGFNLFFYFEERLRAADVLESAIGLSGAPNYLAPLAARLRAESAGLEIAAAFLARMAESTGDEYARAEYLKALDEIEVERRARYLDAAREEYWRRHGRDIERVEDLLVGPDPVLRALPRAQLHHDGFRWILDPESGQIVSSYYGIRYRLHAAESDEARRERWRTQREGGTDGGET